MYETLTPEVIRQDILDRIEDETLSKNEGSVLWHTVSAVAYRIWETYQAMNALIPIAYVDDTSGEYLEKRCGEVGIVRKAGTKATCTVSLTGSNGLIIPAGTVFATANGLSFLLDEAVTLSDGTGEGALTAEEEGASYNIAAAALSTMQTAISGLTGYTNTAAAGGADEETDEELYARLQDYWLKPVTSGNANEYEAWAKSVAGVGYAKVLPLWNGPGTVKVVIANEDMEPVDGAVIVRCGSYIEPLHPIGASVTVVSATGVWLDIAATVATEGDVDETTIADEFSSVFRAYVITGAMQEGIVRYYRIMKCLLLCDGVIDITGLTVNSNTDNILLSDTEIPLLGEVAITIAQSD